jgi:hypothetical protein
MLCSLVWNSHALPKARKSSSWWVVTTTSQKLIFPRMHLLCTLEVMEIRVLNMLMSFSQQPPTQKNLAPTVNIFLILSECRRKSATREQSCRAPRTRQGAMGNFPCPVGRMWSGSALQQHGGTSRPSL